MGYWAVEEVMFVGDYGEHSVYRIVCVCKTEDEANRRAKELAHKYTSPIVLNYQYGEDIGS